MSTKFVSVFVCLCLPFKCFYESFQAKSVLTWRQNYSKSTNSDRRKSIQSHAVYDRVIFVYLLLYQDMADFVLRYMDIFYTRHTSSWYIEHLIILHGFIHVLMHPWKFYLNMSPCMLAMLSSLSVPEVHGVLSLVAMSCVCNVGFMWKRLNKNTS